MTVIKKIGKKAVCLLLAAGLFVACASPAGTADTAKTREKAKENADKMLEKGYAKAVIRNNETREEEEMI